MKINPENFAELIKKGYNLDLIYLLTLINQNEDISLLCKDSMKISSLVQALIRKGLITENEEKVTDIGKELLELANSKASKKITRRKPSTTDFEEWWKIFPGTDSFIYKEMTFKGSRALRKGKDECRLKFDKILLEGDYTAAQLIDALKYEIAQKKESSYVSKINKLSYMQGTIPYLNQRSFEPYIELIKDGVEIKSAPEKAGGTDI